MFNTTHLFESLCNAGVLFTHRLTHLTQSYLPSFMHTPVMSLPAF